VEPASIRSKNPGAMWGRTGKRPSADKIVPTNNPLALKWGSVDTEYLSDGLGQGNNIAVFPTYVQGICAQLDLWRSPRYKDKRFADAIDVWDGHNYTPSYIAYVLARVPGMTRDTVLDDTFWRGPMAIPFLKAQAGHEAGQTYPAPDADWIEAQRRVLGLPRVNVPTSAPTVVPAPPPVVQPAHKKAAVVVGSAGAAGAAAHAAGFSHSAVALIVIAVAVASIAGLIIHNRMSS
jgi:hypothetical protein